MIYLRKFTLLDEETEPGILDGRRIYNNYYPIGIFSRKGLKDIDFTDITIFAGSNGCGKSTLLNIISEKLKAVKKEIINKGTIFSSYVKHCESEMAYEEPFEIKHITSDDIFDYLLDIRAINNGVNVRKEKLTQEFLINKYNSEDNFTTYEKIKDEYDAKRKTMSKYIRERLINNNIIEESNGETALMFWEKEIKENGIYLLDEPENSLSTENQLKLKTFIEESVRFYNCQFIISTHSPFLLSLKDAKIYDLDSNPVCQKNWYDLNNVRLYYDLFKENADKFK